MDVVNSELTDDMLEETVKAKVQSNWNGKKLECISTQTDGEGREVENSDSRSIRVEKSRSVASDSSAPEMRSGQFIIVDRYPDGLEGETPTMLMAPEERVTFSCKSSLVWDICRWKRPNSVEPCGMFNDGDSKSCNGLWGSVDGGSGWEIRHKDDLTCEITGTASEFDAGEWNCELQSKPILNDNEMYEHDQEYFILKTVHSARLQADWPPEVDLVDGDEVQFEVGVTDAYPLPEIKWFLNSREFKPELVDKTAPKQDSQGMYSFKQTMLYVANVEDAGKKLICIVRQIDDEENVVEQQQEVFLGIKAAPPPEQTKSMSAGIIGAIIAVACFILLIVILLCVAFRTGKLCFNERPEKKVPKSETEIQTEAPVITTAGVGTDFGPEKPERTFGSRDVLEPFLDEDENKENFADDEIKHYEDEGTGSRAGSIESLDTAADKKDWTETLHTLGPKFSGMTDYLRGKVDDAEESEKQKNDAYEQV